jgi:hypothetical protein
MFCVEGEKGSIQWTIKLCFNHNYPTHANDGLLARNNFSSLLQRDVTGRPEQTAVWLSLVFQSFISSGSTFAITLKF